MAQWRNDTRKEPNIIGIDSLVPTDNILWKVKKIKDYEWLYE